MKERDARAGLGAGAGSAECLGALNALLAPMQAGIEATCHAPIGPVVLVIGPPRGGTTLLSQLLAASGRFGYLSNFVARFWMAPAVGARIEQALGIRESAEPVDFSSRYGHTFGWGQPHEFGYFWDRWFDFGQETHWVEASQRARVDAAGLRRALASLEREYGRPMAFKNNTWCTFQADLLAEMLPTAVFVACTREPLHVAQSLLLARRRLLGDDAQWWSVRPRRYRWLRTRPPLEQVARQALDIEREMHESLSRVHRERVVWAPYAAVCRDPVGTVVRILRAAGLEEDSRARLAAVLPRRLEPADGRSLESVEYGCLEGLVRELAGEPESES